ncbi:hypothetical protein JCM11491_001092 [Sporobolomyces phaffii]
MSGETSIATIRAQLDAADSYLIAWTAILYWDWLSTLPKEIEFIWRAKVTPLKVAFLAQRYGTLVFMATAATLLLADVPTSVCSKIFWLETLGLDYVLLSTDVLLSIRVLALYENSRKVFIGLLLLLVTEMSLLILAATQVRALKLPPVLGVDSCIPGDPPGTNEQMALLFYVAPFVVNALLLLATFYRSWSITKQLQGVKLPILQHLVKDGALYFACITIVNAVNVYFYNQPYDAIKSFNVCAVVALSSALSCRLALSLHDKASHTTSTRKISLASLPPPQSTTTVREA